MGEQIEIDGRPYVLSETQFAYSGGLAKSFVIPGQVLLYGFTVSSTNVAAQFVQLFDAQTLPADGAVPVTFLAVTTNAQARGYYGKPGRRFTGGIVLCNSSTAGTKTIGSADCLFDVHYARLLDDTGET